MLGPIDYIVVGFKGNDFDGSILKELGKASKNGTIRVIDLFFIMKDKDGNIEETEFVDQSEDLRSTFGDLRPDENLPLMSDSDVAKIGEQMKNETAAGVLVLEHLWAKGLKQAIIDADGFLIADGRVHPEAVEEAVKELETSKANA